MTPRTATLIGLTAILMWSLLAVLTVASGKVPAFQLAAMTFAIGALVGSLTWIGRGEAIGALRQRPLAWIVGVGGLFGYHALYFLALRFCAAGRSRPIELSLAAVDRAVLLASAGRTAVAAPHHRRAARAMRHGAAVRRQCQWRLRARDNSRIDRGVSSRPLCGRPIR